MRSLRSPIWLAAALAALILPAAIGAAAGDSLSGFGRLTLGTATLSFNVSARSGPSGEDPSGTIRIDRTGTHTFSGVADVICLRASGNVASAAGRLREPVANPNEPGTTYQYVILWITDNGSPGHGGDEINSGVTWGPPGSAPQPNCLSFVGGAPSDAGNLTVSDATP